MQLPHGCVVFQTQNCVLSFLLRMNAEDTNNDGHDIVYANIIDEQDFSSDTRKSMCKMQVLPIQLCRPEHGEQEKYSHAHLQKENISSVSCESFQLKESNTTCPNVFPSDDHLGAFVWELSMYTPVYTLDALGIAIIFFLHGYISIYVMLLDSELLILDSIKAIRCLNGIYNILLTSLHVVS